MWEVRNNGDMCDVVFFLKLAKENDLESASTETREKIIEIKRTLRKYLHRPRSESRVVCDNGIDGCIILTPLPETIMTAEDADSYFMENEYMERSYSAYDCTGRIFTCWYKIFQRNGRFWVYHNIRCDC